MTESVTVRVPGSTANLGAGFDCVGIAVNRWVRLTVRRDPSSRAPARLERGGALAGLDVPAGDDLLVTGFVAACRAAGKSAPLGLAFDVASDVPVGRGLGSSAAAVVAGAAAARAFCGLELDDAALTLVCADLEGHPDNVAPAVSGGAVLALQAPDGLVLRALRVHPSLVLVFAIPDFTLETERARGVLPATLPYRTAVTAAARGAALVAGLESADPALLGLALDDVLHVPFRRALVPGYDEVTRAAIAAGAFGATLSGSGSTLVALAQDPTAAAVERAMADAWRSRGVRVETFRQSGRVPGHEVS